VTWTPQYNASPVTVTADAEIPEQNLKGRVQTKVGFLTLDAPPSIDPGAVVNGASYAAAAPVAPGSFVTIRGSKLAQGAELAGAVPFPTSLAGSSVVLAGLAAPLLYASDGQVNAIVPYEVGANTDQQVIVTRGNSLSAPQPVTVAPAAPGLFTIDSSGKGQGIIVGVDASGAQAIADVSHPVKRGDAIIIYCTGLGKVDQTFPAGSLTPLAPFTNTINRATVTIGGVDANVFFSGMTANFVGLYQVNAFVPNEVTPGDKVPVVVTAAGQSSVPVTIAVR
jgi:uncharacterized protein (TIGR03437 family)